MVTIKEFRALARVKGIAVTVHRGLITLESPVGYVLQSNGTHFQTFPYSTLNEPMLSAAYGGKPSTRKSVIMFATAAVQQGTRCCSGRCATR